MNRDRTRSKGAGPSGALRVPCGVCGETVRLPMAGDGAESRCEHCGTAVDAARVHDLSGEALADALRRSPLPLLVDFHAEWCAPCKWLDPILEELAGRSRGRFVVAKVDTDEAPDAAREHRIGSVPTVILFEGGRESARSLGVEPDRLRAMVGLDEGGADPFGPRAGAPEG
jgi:thioredoxin 2